MDSLHDFVQLTNWQFQRFAKRERSKVTSELARGIYSYCRYPLELERRLITSYDVDVDVYILIRKV